MKSRILINLLSLKNNIIRLKIQKRMKIKKQKINKKFNLRGEKYKLNKHKMDV